MDVASSSSLLSSGVGNDEFESRDDSFSAFLHSSSGAALPAQPQPLLSACAASANFLNYLDPSTPLLPVDSFHCTSAAAVAAASLAALPPSVFHPPPSTQPEPQTITGPRGSRKRSRSSRRAPTIVLSTDTSNFRAMVQEFTGIPSPPFVAGSTSLGPRSRLDLFHAAASPLPFLLRPFPHKVQSPSSPFASIFTPNSSNTCTTSPSTTTVNSLVWPQNPLHKLQALIKPPSLQTPPSMAATYSAKPHPVASVGYGSNVDLPPPVLVRGAESASLDVQLRQAGGGDCVGSSVLRSGGVCKPNLLASGAPELDREKASARGEGVAEAWFQNSD